MSEFNLEAALKVFDDADPSTSFDAIMKAALRALCNKPEEKTYSIGDRFHYEHDEEDDDFECTEDHMLAQVETKQVALIGTTGGNRWSEHVKVGDVDKITVAEFSDIVGEIARPDQFTRIEKP